MEDVYEECYIEFLDYLAKNFDLGMAGSAVHAEALTNILREVSEEEFEKLTEGV